MGTSCQAMGSPIESLTINIAYVQTSIKDIFYRTICIPFESKTLYKFDTSGIGTRMYLLIVLLKELYTLTTNRSDVSVT